MSTRIHHNNGKTRHLEHSPECKIVPMAEHFDNRCPECDRNFRNPSELKERRRYICTHQKEGKQQTESDTKEPIPKQMQAMPIKDKGAETINKKKNYEKEKREGKQERAEEGTKQHRGKRGKADKVNDGRWRQQQQQEKEQEQGRQEQGQQEQIVNMETNQKTTEHENRKQHTRHNKERENENSKKNMT